MNIVSKKPTDHFEGFARALYGMYGQYAVEGAVGMPITDVLGFRVAATANGQDGWITNITNGEREPHARNFAGRLTLAFKPSDTFDAMLKVEATDNRMKGTPQDLPLQWAFCPRPPFPTTYSASGNCAIALAQGVPMGLDRNSVAGLPGEGSQLKNQEAVLTMNYRVPGATLTSVTGYSHYDFFEDLATSLLPTPFLQAEWSETYRQWSQELRLVSDTGGRLEYLAGLYFQTDKLPYNQVNSFTFLTDLLGGIPPLQPYFPLGYRQGVIQDEKIYSAFGSLTWNVTDKLKMIGSLRASRVKKDFTAHLNWGTAGLFDHFVMVPPDAESLILNIIGIGGGATLNPSQSYANSSSAIMPSARIQYQLSDEVMFYARYDRGFLAGGFNGADVFKPGDISAFGPEYVNAYEVGMKSRFFDNRLTFNIDAFWSDYSDLQASTSMYATSNIGDGFVSKITNAASARSRGIEVEADAQLGDFHFGAQVTYLDAKYLDYRNAGAGALQSFCATFNTNQAAFATHPECSGYSFPVPPNVDLSGKPTAYAPTWSGSVMGRYVARLPGDYQLSFEADPYFTSSYYTISADPIYKIDSHVRLDARVSLDSPSGQWGLDVIGKNVTDKTITAGFADIYFASKEPPRTVAVQLRAKF